jgi:hypothetical protein
LAKVDGGFEVKASEKRLRDAEAGGIGKYHANWENHKGEAPAASSPPA